MVAFLERLVPEDLRHGSRRKKWRITDNGYRNFCWPNYKRYACHIIYTAREQRNFAMFTIKNKKSPKFFNIFIKKRTFWTNLRGNILFWRCSIFLQAMANYMWMFETLSSYRTFAPCYFCQHVPPNRRGLTNNCLGLYLQCRGIASPCAKNLRLDILILP